MKNIQAIPTKTKIIASYGPSLKDKKVLRDVFLAGAKAIRINTSHGKINEYKKILLQVEKIEKNIMIPISTLIETKGSEIRIGEMTKSDTQIFEDDIIKIHFGKEIKGDNKNLWINYDKLSLIVRINQEIFIDNEKLHLKVINVDIDNSIILTRALNTAIIRENKTFKIKDVDLKLPFLSIKDQEVILFAIKNNVDYIIVPFVKTETQAKIIYNFVRKIDRVGKVKLIFRINDYIMEEDFENIFKYVAGIMFSRNDLASKLSFLEYPKYQNALIEKANSMNKIIILSTEMLESMVTSLVPLKIEIAEAYHNSLLDIDSIVLSDETAIGQYPKESVFVLNTILLETEKNESHDISEKEFLDFFEGKNLELLNWVFKYYDKNHTKHIVLFTDNFNLIKKITKFKSNLKFVIFSTEKKLVTKFNLFYNIHAEVISSLDIFNHQEDLKKLLKSIKMPLEKNIPVIKKEDYKNVEWE